MKIDLIKTDAAIEDCFETYTALRPHLNDKPAFVKQVKDQQAEGYQIAAIVDDGAPVACIGFRTLTTLAWGKVLYIDDLITRHEFREKGYGGKLLDYAIEEGKRLQCKQIHLDTGFTRFAAHKVYLNRGFEINCMHLALNISED